MNWKGALKKAGKYGIRAGTAIASGGGSEIYRAANNGKADPLTRRGESYVDQLFPGDPGENPYLGAFAGAEGDIAALGKENDARRRAGLEQSLAMFGPVDSVLSKMYGPGAVGAPVNVDALFGASPGGGGNSLPPGWSGRLNASMFGDDPALPEGWSGRLSSSMFGPTASTAPRMTHPMFRRGG